jgi:hypothetical protein
MSADNQTIIDQLDSIDAKTIARVLYLGIKALAEERAAALEPVDGQPGLYTVPSFRQWKETK